MSDRRRLELGWREWAAYLVLFFAISLPLNHEWNSDLGTFFASAVAALVSGTVVLGFNLWRHRHDATKA